jgi:hypothetical protein
MLDPFCLQSGIVDKLQLGNERMDQVEVGYNKEQEWNGSVATQRASNNNAAPPKKSLTFAPEVSERDGSRSKVAMMSSPAPPVRFHSSNNNNNQQIHPRLNVVNNVQPHQSKRQSNTDNGRQMPPSLFTSPPLRQPTPPQYNGAIPSRRTDQQLQHQRSNQSTSTWKN